MDITKKHCGACEERLRVLQGWGGEGGVRMQGRAVQDRRCRVHLQQALD